MFLEHITRDGERWDSLAWQYYGDPLGYPRIIAANPHVGHYAGAALRVVVTDPGY